MRKSRTADFGACAICKLVSMRSRFSGSIRSSGPSLSDSFAASSTPVADSLPDTSQRRAISAQVIFIPLARSPFVRSTRLSVIGRRDAPSSKALLVRVSR